MKCAADQYILNFFGILIVCSCFMLQPTHGQQGSSFREPWRVFHSNVRPGSCGGVDAEVRHTGTQSGFIYITESTSDSHRDNMYIGIMNLLQSVDATKFRGERWHLKCYLKTEGVKGAAFLEVQSNTQGHEFKRCQTALIDGTHDWESRDLDFDVPAKADVVVLRFVLTGQGRAWVDDITLESAHDTQGRIACEDSIPNRSYPGSEEDFGNFKPRLEDLDFESKPPFQLDWHRRRVCIDSEFKPSSGKGEKPDRREMAPTISASSSPSVN
jgi:hypothetical protein